VYQSILLRRSAPPTPTSVDSADFQIRMGRPGTSPDARNTGVLLLTRTVDREADLLSLHLAARGMPLLRLDSEHLLGTDLSWNPLSGDLTRDGQRFRPTICWSRYFAATAVRRASDPWSDRYARDSWGHFPAALATGAARFVNGPPTSRPDRLAQLRAARGVGLTVPPTIVTTRPSAALADLPGSDDVLVKTLGEHYVEATPGWARGVHPVRLTRAELSTMDVDCAPLLVQQFLPSDTELRVQVVGARMFAYRVTKSTFDAPFTDGEFTAVPVPVPDGLRRPIRDLVGRFGFDVVAFDFLCTRTGPVFLEVNVECSWRWLERSDSTAPITRAVCDFITGTQPAVPQLEDQS
jgi:hypothetical protein